MELSKQYEWYCEDFVPFLPSALSGAELWRKNIACKHLAIIRCLSKIIYLDSASLPASVSMQVRYTRRANFDYKVCVPR
jgi:hypothetical protein